MDKIYKKRERKTTINLSITNIINNKLTINIVINMDAKLITGQHKTQLWRQQRFQLSVIRMLVQVEK